MCEKKTKGFMLRLPRSQAYKLQYISQLSNLSQAEILRIGLDCVIYGQSPCENKKLKSFYKFLEETK